jgi:hypothetical protein
MINKKRSKKKPSSLAKRAKISHSTKDLGGGGSRIINWKDIDGEVKFFQPAVGKNAINIIPFEIKSKNHPLVKQGAMEIGELDYCLDIWTHRNVGPSESSVICLKRTYGKACPICEEAEKLKKRGKEKEAAALAAKRRVIYNVEDTRKKPGVLQVFEVSHYLFEKELIDEARTDDGDEKSDIAEDGVHEGSGGDFVDFADPEAGFVVRFRCSKTSQGGFEFNEFKSFSFLEREDPIDDDLLASAISFDEHLNVLSYEDVQAILFGADEEEADDDDDDEDEKPRRKKPAKKPSKDADEDDDDDDNDEDDGDEDEDEKPAKKPVKNRAKKKPSEEEEEEEDEDEKPKRKPGNSAAKNKCPHGHVFGKDADEQEECEDCDLWAKCIGNKK